ncbi:MAG: B12-binding domain-containing radical SAM protein [Candidatus Lokiarchaeota archaeon]|nr:B12-binding domain-containing radical SAM protein [Candidatus Lokiarchaeota archaeon]
MRVLLVKPDNPNVYKHGPQASIVYPPLGLEYIAANIDDIADVRIIDRRTKSLSLNIFGKIIEQFQPDYVGISVNYSSQIYVSHRIAGIAKTYGSRTVVGGWHPTLVPSETLEFKSFDIVVRGEGEITMRELIQSDSPIGVAGLSYKRNGKQIHNPDRELMDLKHIQSPNRQFRSASAKKTYNFFGFPVDSIETGRGCPFTCNFCCIPYFYKKTYRRRANQDIINELQSFEIKKRSSFVFIVDDNFIVDRKSVVELCDAIIRNSIKKYFITQARVDTIVKYPKIFEKMADAGFFYLFLGLESFSDQTLEKLNKRIKFRQIKLAIKILHDLGYIIQGNIILGANIEDTKQDLESTIEIARSLEIDVPTFSLMTPFPGTKLMEQALREDLLLTKDWKDYNWSVPVLKYQNLSSDDLSYYLTKANEELLSFKKAMSGITRFIRSRGLSYHTSRISPVDIFNVIFQILKNLKTLL